VLVEPDGRGGERLWVASSQDGLGLYEGGRWRTFPPPKTKGAGPDLRLVTRVTEEDGSTPLWVSADGGELFTVDGEGRFSLMSTPWPKAPGEFVLDVLVRRAGGSLERWIALRQGGIWRLRAGRWAAYRPRAAVGPWRVVKIAEQVGGDGRAWLWASTDLGLARYDGEQWELLGLETDLPDADLLGLSLLPEKDGRALLWAGSARSGIVRYDVTDPRHPRRLAPDLPPPPDPWCYSALRDSKGRIYVASNNGVQLLVPEPSGGFHERVFGRRDGMVHEECNTNGQTIDAHDRYWTGTLAGLAVYEPESETPDVQPKPLRLTHVTIDGTEADPAALRVPPRARELRFDFALLSWQRESESRFRTQLLGWDTQPGPWVAQSFRLFGGLSPGRYVLRIEGRDYAGVASRPLELGVEVLPAWWQTLWFRAAFVLFFAFAGPLFYLQRVGRISRQKAELESLVASRTHQLAQANEQLAQLSREDGLTGVANRRRLDEALDDEWRRARRLQLPLSFLLLDVDLFKDYNDRLGHQAGDECLKAVAKAVADAHTRAGELVARYGGEEFGVLITGVALAGAAASAENVRRRVAELTLPHPREPGAVVTVSVGVASASPARGGSPRDLVESADHALYRAKREGRNCVRAVEASDALRHSSPEIERPIL
jgi:diguanylate cyclase (GGDEF)-like protein